MYLDITENMLNLKKFLKIRDTRPEFEPVRERGAVGIPCIYVDDGEALYFGVEGIDFETLK